jgi:hypothetical protein
MALTIVESGDTRANIGIGQILQQATITPAASDYPTGGYAMYSAAGSAPNNAGQYFGLAVIHGLWPVGYTGTAINYIWHYNKTTCKLQVFGISVATAGATIYTLTEVAALTDLSGGTVTLWAVGF